MFGPLDPLDPTLPNPNLANWQEHQRRQRTLRMLMMFLMVLLLMDGDEPIERRNARNSKQTLRNSLAESRNRYGYFRMYVDDNGDLVNPLGWDVWRGRREEDSLISVAVGRDGGSGRYKELIKKNGGRDVEGMLRDYAEKKVIGETKVTLGLNDELRMDGVSPSLEEEGDGSDALLIEDDVQLFHYPRNATGYYRGLWMKVPDNSSKGEDLAKEKIAEPKVAQDINPWVQHQLEQTNQDVGLFILPPNTIYESGTKYTNSTKNSTEGIMTPQQQNQTLSTPSLSLTKEAGRAAFQLYSRPIPAMTELSIVDGLVKLYDGMTTSFVSKRTDVLLRVRGVIIHGSGKISLVSSSSMEDVSFEGKRRSVLGIARVKKDHVDEKSDLSSEEEQTFEPVEEENVEDITDRQRHRRLQDLLNAFLSQPVTTEHPQPNTASKGLFQDASMLLSQIRDGVLELYSSQFAHEIVSMEAMQKDGWSVLQSIDEEDSLEFDRESKPSENPFRHQHSTRALQTVDSNVTNVLDSGELIVESDELQMNEDITLNTLKPVDPSDQLQTKTNFTHETGATPMQEQSTQGAINKNNSIPQSDTAVFTIEAEFTHDDGHVSRSATSTQEQPTLTQSNKQITVIKQIKEPQYTYPFPYVHDDSNDSIKKSTSPASRRLPARELALEANAANCEFEMNIDVHEQTWTFGEWRNAILQRFRTVQAFNPYLKSFDRDTERLKRAQILMIKSQVGFTEDSVKEALVMTMSGIVQSKNCNFTSFVNVTAIRTNWEHTTAKAINYSFYMMLTCLMQIVVLLRQLLHTQAQSAASNVSLFCIGWQTVLDAILCIAHIFLCLVMQPLFTAFASVAFFKLLIFCVIEMKYMALIIQARNNANNPNHTQDDLRRQITLLHLRFYAALMVAIMSFWYLGQTHRTLYILLLYSFWVPQIILNAITESRKPMHSYYIYGMSVTRLIAPMYVFAVQNNFLKEVNPDFPSDPTMVHLLILWVLMQTAILVGQGKYGTRFMIPQRLLPPKFDYHRPIPASLLPTPPSPPSPPNGSSSEIELGPLLNGESSPQGARNRRSRLGSRVDESNNGTTTISTNVSEMQTLDCVICYNEIDINDRSGYMLAPCLHIFHSNCLEQWMEVKMECPICRCNLPAI